MGKILPPRKIYNLEYSKIPELVEPQIGDSDLEFWGMYKLMSIKTPVELSRHISHAKMTAPKTNIRQLESKVDGDWYFLLQEIFGNFIEKIKPGKTKFESNLNGQNINKNYGELAHLRCGKSSIDHFGVRVSTCLYCGGNEIQIPIAEVDNFEFADYYFFEKDGLFLVLNIKKFLNLNPTQKWFTVGEPTENSEKRFANYVFNTTYLIKFGCIDYYGFCDGNDIISGRAMKFSKLYSLPNGKPREKYKTFSLLWMRGCQTTLSKEKYLAFYISPSPDSREIIYSSTIAGISENFTDKKGKKLTRQAFAAQARTNLNSFRKGCIPQKLSLSYIEKKPYFIIKVEEDISEESLKYYLRSLREDYEQRKEIENITEFLINRSIQLNKTITKYSMSVDDYFAYVEWKTGLPLESMLFLRKEEYKLESKYKIKSDISNDYYKSKIAYYTNRKRGFITKKEIQDMKIEILSGENFCNYNFYKMFLKIKGIKQEENLESYSNEYYYQYELLDKNKSFSYLKTIIRDRIDLLNLPQNGGP